MAGGVHGQGCVARGMHGWGVFVPGGMPDEGWRAW